MHFPKSVSDCDCSSSFKAIHALAHFGVAFIANFSPLKLAAESGDSLKYPLAESPRYSPRAL